MKFVYDDGGREAAGYKGKTGDCACRAVAIAAQRPYQEVYDLINEYAKKERTGKRKRKVSNARTGVYQTTMLKVMSHYGFKWVATMHIGQGCTVHLRENELPRGRIVCNLSRHYAAVIDGDLYNALFNTSVAVLDNIVDSAQLKFARMRVSVSLNNKGNLTIKFTYSDGATVEV